MSVTTPAKSPDIEGKNLDTVLTAVKANTAAAPAASAQLYGAQFIQANTERDVLNHALATGRLNANAILAASVFGSAGTSALSIPSRDIETTNLQTAVNAVVTTASPQQAFNVAYKDKLERELVAVCIAKGYTTPAFILASSL